MLVGWYATFIIFSGGLVGGGGVFGFIRLRIVRTSGVHPQKSSSSLPLLALATQPLFSMESKIICIEYSLYVLALPLPLCFNSSCVSHSSGTLVRVVSPVSRTNLIFQCCFEPWHSR